MATTKVGFYTPETAKIIAETVAYLRRNGLVQQKGKGNDPQVRGLFGLVFKTPTGGIPAMSGTTPGKAYCPAYSIDPATSQLVTVTDNAGNSATCTQTITVNDNVLPAIICPADIATTTNSGCLAIISLRP